MPEEKKELFKSRELIKDSILYILRRYKELTEQEIQDKLGLRKQSTYNYLNELETEKSIKISYQKLEKNPNVRIAYYSIAKPRIQPEEYQMTFARDIFSNISAPEARREINRQINSSIGALLEARNYMKNLKDEDLIKHVQKMPNLIGPGIDSLLMGKKAFEELSIEYKKVFNRFYKKWKNFPIEKENYLLLIGAFRPFE